MDCNTKYAFKNHKYFVIPYYEIFYFVGHKSSHLVNYRFFASKVQWDFRKWTFIFVHFWNSQNTFGKSNICEHNEKLASHG